MVQCAWFQMRCLRCISATRSQDHCMYHGSSSSICLGGNITSLSGRTSWSTTAVATRVRAVHDIAAGGEVVADVHLSFERGELLMEPVRFHTMFNPLKQVVFL